jgi:hypothetical protein
LAEVAKKSWRSMFAFRGQSRMHYLKVRSPKNDIRPWISLHASGYRFVHDLDWTVCWWSDANGRTPAEALALYKSINAKVNEHVYKLSRWRLHLLRHSLTREFAEQVEDYSSRQFRENASVQKLFPRILLTPEEKQELEHNFGMVMQWPTSFFGSLGQHYGLSSQYLDLTYSPKVAARFALEGNWQRVLNGERVYGYIMSFILPILFHKIQEFKQKWAPLYPTVVDISWIPPKIAKRPAMQHGLSLSNSPSPIYGPYLAQSNAVSCTSFYTVPCRELEDIVKMNLMPDDDPFLEVVKEFQVADEHRRGWYFE